ncbi:VOC family protein [Saccharibacillus sacchari]|uniref:VOC family protein n=1 Tax=Saccharibacillus sacchari TaxID=456493 RepID=A0ACC6PCW9_9BACL
MNRNDLRWDHIVHYVNDLNEPISLFREKGLIAFAGGSHKKWGTHNALSYFGLTYIEFLGVEHRELAESAEPYHVVVRDAAKLLPEHEILSRVVLRTDAIDDVAELLRGKGLELSPILDGERLDASGNLIQWRMFMVQGDHDGLPYPFFIQWNGTDAKRSAALSESGVIRPHPAGDIRLDTAVFGVRDPQATAAHWQEVFGLQADPAAPNTLRVGNQRFAFEASASGTSALRTLIFRTPSTDLQGSTLRIGEGEYRFEAE